MASAAGGCVIRALHEFGPKVVALKLVTPFVNKLYANANGDVRAKAKVARGRGPSACLCVCLCVLVRVCVCVACVSVCKR